MSQEPTPTPDAVVTDPPAPTPTDPPVADPPTDEPEVFDRKYVEQLRKENASYRTRAQEAEARLTEIDDAAKSEAEKALERAERAEQQLVALERKDVAREAGLPAEWADRLRGSTRDELQADAEQLAKSLPARRPDWDSGPKPPAPNDLPDDVDPLTRLSHAYRTPAK